jgi:hypothetical protein
VKFADQESLREEHGIIDRVKDSEFIGLVFDLTPHTTCIVPEFTVVLLDGDPSSRRFERDTRFPPLDQACSPVIEIVRRIPSEQIEKSQRFRDGRFRGNRKERWVLFDPLAQTHEFPAVSLSRDSNKP